MRQPADFYKALIERKQGTISALFVSVGESVSLKEVAERITDFMKGQPATPEATAYTMALRNTAGTITKKEHSTILSF